LAAESSGGAARPPRIETLGGARLVLKQGDITDESADAIVNAANSALAGGGGVDGAIHRRGGPAILAECARIQARDGNCPPGQAVVTTAGNLRARSVIHAVGPIWRGGQAGEEATLRSAYRRSLELAREQGLQTIAFPSISTGAYRYPLDKAARAAIATVREELARGGVAEVRFVLFSDRDFAAYSTALDEELASAQGGIGPGLHWFEELLAGASDLAAALARDRVILDLRRPETLDLVRRDVERIARGMDAEGEPPPMFWSGIPFPERPGPLAIDYCLVISVGGTNTEFALMRLENGEARVLGPDGKEASGAAAAAAKFRSPTPTARDTSSGIAMIDRIVGGIDERLGRHLDALRRSRAVVLSWGFANRAFRTGARVIGGLSAKTTFMTKDQAPFTADLAGKDVGDLFRRAFEQRLGWSPEVTVANDGIMALHYFLTAENVASHSQLGLFINGTGTNFAMAEPYALRPEGIVSHTGEEYQPERITPHRPRRAGEKIERHIVNYETGSIDLAATRTPFDSPHEYPIEENALAGGNAFEQQFEAIVTHRLAPETYPRLLAALPGPGQEAPSGLDVSRIATGGTRALEAIFPGAGLDARTAGEVILACRAITARSALHCALILAAVTRRLRFGLGDAASGKLDLLGMEGSVWKTAGYPELVRRYWQEIVGEPLRVAFVHEKSFDASLPGPLYLAAIHGGTAERNGGRRP
jgi:O-acetyl-ADP-ribose deacetylase (regulator of RNase III)